MQSKKAGTFKPSSTYQLTIITMIDDIKTRSGIKFAKFIGEDNATGKKYKCKAFNTAAEELLQKGMGQVVTIEGYIDWDDYDKTDCLSVQGLVGGLTGLRPSTRGAFAELSKEERREKFECLRKQKEQEGFVPVGIKEEGIRKLAWRRKEDTLFVVSRNRYEDKTEFLLDEGLGGLLMEKIKGAPLAKVKEITDSLLGEFLGGLWERESGRVSSL